MSADGAAHAGGGGSPEVGAGGAAAVPLIVHFALATHGNPVQGLARALAADRKAWPRGAAVLGIKLTQHLAATAAQAAGGGEDGHAVRSYRRWRLPSRLPSAASQHFALPFWCPVFCSGVGVSVGLSLLSPPLQQVAADTASGRSGHQKSRTKQSGSQPAGHRSGVGGGHDLWSTHKPLFDSAADLRASNGQCPLCLCSAGAVAVG
eukprot:COSAG01_NODE_2910_length_6877_cov_3.042785_13_plen_206_part_00